MALKEQSERFSVLPFSLHCTSQSSVAVIENQPKKARSEPVSLPEDVEGRKHKKTKSSSLFLQLPRLSFSPGLQKLAKGLKMLSNLFSIYREDDEEEEVKMEIGYPTDVQHVAHIGWEGLSNPGGMKGWERAPEFFPLSSLSLKQFEMAIASQTEGGGAC